MQHMGELRDNLQASHTIQVTIVVITPTVMLAERLIGRLNQEGSLSYRKLALLIQEVSSRAREQELRKVISDLQRSLVVSDALFGRVGVPENCSPSTFDARRCHGELGRFELSDPVQKAMAKIFGGVQFGDQAFGFGQALRFD